MDGNHISRWANTELSIRSSYAKKYFSLLFPLLRYMGSFRGFLKQGEVTSEIGVGTDQRTTDRPTDGQTLI